MHAAGGETGYVPGEMLCHYVTRPYDKWSERDGYLVLKEGQVVFVEYIGCDGHEEGWLFGYKSGSENHHGWFPQWCIEKISPPAPPVPPTTSRATPSPLRNVPSYALNGCDKERQRHIALDSFARAATPPPDDEEIFQRQITPPPDDDDDVCDTKGPWLSPETTSSPPPPPAPKGQPISQLPPPGLDVPPDAESIQSVKQGLEKGSDLPMYQYCAELKRKVKENRVVMVDAATGSGKSTLVPLCLAQQCLEEGRSCRIVVTQPRRMAAKKLAERVATQVGRVVGSLIGYRVGGQDKRDDPQGLVVYVTVGHFLEALVHNPAHLENFSHVVLDEVHERFVEADFLMALLRMLLSRPESVRTRIVVMSATLQKALHLFFKPVLLPAPHRAEMTSITSPGSTPFKVEDYFLEDLPLHIRQKGPSFGELLPKNLKTLKKSMTRSDKLTSACQKLTAVGAKWIKHLYEVEHINVVLAFLPGLDQMKELKNHLTSMVEPAMQPTIPEKPLKPDIILMHSALDDNDYKHAADELKEGQWKVIIATNMAESSLTLPSVGAVLDFGMHRVNEYNDESKMSTLVTSWCSKASLKQRRGRTGRTNDGLYFCMLERRVYEQLEDYDQSGVERSSLTKVALEAAYLADVLSRVPQIRAGLPATVPARETSGRRIVEFFDGDVGLWRICAAEEAKGECEWAAEEDLALSQLHLEDVLKLLPSPPKTARIQTAITDLQEFGTLTVGERPTALGIACLKLPAEVHLARLVVLGWSMNMGPSACVLAAALSLTPSCDVFLTPMNTQGDLDRWSSDLLRNSIAARTKYDGGWLSEPLTIYALCEKWLQNRGGLGQVPQIDEKEFVHKRLWSQFSAKVVDLWRAMQRLVPREDRQSYHDLRLLQNLARGSHTSFADIRHLLEQDREKLLALLTWGLAPGCFLAIGQSPSIYGKGSYGEFWKTAEKLDWDVADCLYWKRSQGDVEYTLNQLRGYGTIRHVESAHIKEVIHEDVTDEKSKKACIVHLQRGQNDSGETKSKLEFEMLYRLCSPFNGKATIGNLKIVSPVHPCALNWYMPYRNCEGLKEVCLNWKSPAYSLLTTTRRWPDRCRPKRFLVASGGDYRTDYHGDTKTRVTMLRGTSVLPSRDGGRQALLWCLAAGVPRDAQMTALCAPCEAAAGKTLKAENFEVRGLWMWERTLRLPNSAIITSGDLKVVNDFRKALKKMQSYQPHRLAGTWYAQDAAFRIDYLEDEDEAHDGEDGKEGRRDILIISKLSAGCEAPCEDVRKLYPCPGGWSLATDGDAMLEELPDSGLCYEGRVLTRTEELAILEQFNPKSLEALRKAAEELLKVSKKPPQRRSNWPGRLVPLWADTAMSPFDLTDIEKRLTNFCSDLEDRSDLWGFISQEEDNNCDMEDDEVYIDTSLEKINKGYMWTLAESETFDLDNCGYLQMPENSIALPTAAVCVMCEEQGKTFSKRQLANPIHNRLCQDCILEKTAALQGNAYIKAEKSILRPPTAAQTMPKLVPAAAAQLPKVCSVCKKLLDAKNSTSTQRTKPTNKRKCQACAVKPT